MGAAGGATTAAGGVTTAAGGATTAASAQAKADAAKKKIEAKDKNIKALGDAKKATDKLATRHGHGLQVRQAPKDCKSLAAKLNDLKTAIKDKKDDDIAKIGGDVGKTTVTDSSS